MNEEWRPIPEWPGYEVSDMGNVRCWRPRNACAPKPAHPRSVKPIQGTNGYLMFSVSNNGLVKRLTVHGSVLRAFIGEPPEGMEGAHKDGNRSNCCLTNLVYKTHQANMDDRKIHGTVPRGDVHYNARLDDESARQIFLAPNIRDARAIAHARGVRSHSAKSIRMRKAWRHATEGLVLGGGST